MQKLIWNTSAEDFREYLGIEPHLFHSHSKFDGARDGHPHISLNPTTHHKKEGERRDCCCVFCELDGKDAERLGFLGTVATATGRMTPEWRRFQLAYYAKLPQPPNALLDSGGKSIYGIWVFPTPIDAARADALMAALGQHWGDDSGLDYATHLGPKPGTKHYRSGKPAAWTDLGGTTDPDDLECALPHPVPPPTETIPHVGGMLAIIPPWIPDTSQRDFYLHLCWAVCAWCRAYPEQLAEGETPLTLLTNHSPQKAKVWPALIKDFDPERSSPGLLIHLAKKHGYQPPSYTHRNKAAARPPEQKLLPWREEMGLVNEVVDAMLNNEQALEPAMLRRWGIQELARSGVRIGGGDLNAIVNESWQARFRPADDGDPNTFTTKEFTWNHEGFQSTGFDVLAGRAKIGKTSKELQRAHAWLNGKKDFWGRAILDNSPTEQRRICIIGPDMDRSIWGKFLTQHDLCQAQDDKDRAGWVTFTIDERVRLVTRHLGLNALLALIHNQATLYPHTHFILDSLSTLCPALDENSQNDMAPFLAALRVAVGEATACVIHHVTRDAARAGIVGADLLRGSGAIPAAFENIRTLTDPVFYRGNDVRVLQDTPFIFCHTVGRADLSTKTILRLEDRHLVASSEEEFDAWVKANRGPEGNGKGAGRGRPSKEEKETSAWRDRRDRIMEVLDNPRAWQDPKQRWVQTRVIAEHTGRMTAARKPQSALVRDLHQLVNDRWVELRSCSAEKGAGYLWRRGIDQQIPMPLTG